MVYSRHKIAISLPLDLGTGIAADSAEKWVCPRLLLFGLIGESEPSAGNPASLTVGGCSGKAHFSSACGPCGAAWHLSQVAFRSQECVSRAQISSNNGGR